MSSKLKSIWLFAFGLALNPLAYADDHEDIELAEEGESEAEYVRHMSPNENADLGTLVSNMSRNPESEYQGREFGQWVSEQVRQDLTQEAHRNARAELGAENGRGGRPEE